MLDAANFGAQLRDLSTEQVRATLCRFLPANATTEQRIAAVEAGLRSPLGQALRETMARWIVDEIVPLERLVPPAYIKWRGPVRDSMMFVVAHLSPGRLAPKLVEQIDLPPEVSPEERLLRLIAKVPGLQKLGQVIARNQHLRPGLRKALARLENSIRDVRAEEIHAIVQQELGARIEKYAVEVSSFILSEASVSAVVRFSWRDPDNGQRQRGVFKILKPHIPAYFAEDMDYLQKLAQHFADRHHTYGFPAHLIPDTFKKVRRQLRHEVNFSREQRTLRDAEALYRHVPGVHVPQLIQPLCTRRVTALTEEHGAKITNAAKRLPLSRRARVAEQLIEAMVAVPLLAPQPEAVFHGDPHAGNLLYNLRSGELAVIDWALRERLTREQRRHLALLFVMVGLRDPLGASNEILALSQMHIAGNSRQAQAVRKTVNTFFERLPVKPLAAGAGAMELLEQVALQGVKFPGALVMMSKVLFTLNGILSDIGGSPSRMGLAVARRVAQHWITRRGIFLSPLKASDWLTLHCSALLYPTRLCLKYERSLLDRYLPKDRASAAVPAS